ncbi:MAG: hypothetical protein AB7P33_16110 [Dehalococcoidia bacterium]
MELDELLERLNQLAATHHVLTDDDRQTLEQIWPDLTPAARSWLLQHLLPFNPAALWHLVIPLIEAPRADSERFMALAFMERHLRRSPSPELYRIIALLLDQLWNPSLTAIERWTVVVTLEAFPTPRVEAAIRDLHAITPDADVRREAGYALAIWGDAAIAAQVAEEALALNHVGTLGRLLERRDAFVLDSELMARMEAAVRGFQQKRR